MLGWFVSRSIFWSAEVVVDDNVCHGATTGELLVDVVSVFVGVDSGFFFVWFRRVLAVVGCVECWASSWGLSCSCCGLASGRFCFFDGGWVSPSEGVELGVEETGMSTETVVSGMRTTSTTSVVSGGERGL